VVTHVGNQGERYVEMDHYAGLGYRAPVLAACFSIFLLSLIGIPLTAGFLGKFYIFRAALRADLIVLTVWGVLNSGIAAYYYLRILVSMYMESSSSDIPLRPVPPSLAAVLAICAGGTLYLGIFPNAVLRWALHAAELLQGRL